ncbi:hypothetical protein [Streptomyces sp. JW3]|uniref:hypothetical protein n=1 Tax=Streptomyces sp. JW3 TaxID=3456955 RepID=UPI003FA46C99
MYREFIVPSDQEIVEQIGEYPKTEKDDSARIIALRGAGKEFIRFSYDTLARSVRIRWINQKGEEFLDFFREGATSMKIHTENGLTCFSITFHTGECAGQLKLQVFPNLSIKDELLFQ